MTILIIWLIHNNPNYFADYNLSVVFRIVSGMTNITLQKYCQGATN